MKVRLISLTPTCFPNLALMKLSAFHKARGDEVSLDEPEPDIVYVSSPFSQFRNACDYSKMFLDAKIEYGGYGFSDRQLPFEIEHLMPDYSIFNCDHSLGFTTRGCFRNCWFCLTPDSLVVAETGAKPISEISVGERVLTHRGHYQPVTAVMQREYHGEIIQLNSGALSSLFPTKITAEHPVWMRHVSSRTGGEQLTTFKWIGAGEIVERYSRYSRDVFAYPRTQEIEGLEQVPNFEPLKLDVNFMTLLGWYLSEGYVCKTKGRGYHRTTFCLGHSIRESEYAEQIRECVAKKGYKAHVFKTKIGIRIHIENVKLARWLVQEFGTGASNKKIPLWVRLLPTNLLHPMVNAWAFGDGWFQVKKNTPTWKVTTVSPNLVLGLHEIVLKLGYTSTINRHNLSAIIQGRLVNVKPAYTVLFHEARIPRRSVVFDHDYIYRPVLNSSRREYSGMVYNLEVAEDNSYCTPAFALHNCIVPKMEGMIRKNSPIEEFHNLEHDTVELLDNNILYFEDWFMKNTDYLIKHDLKVIENGIDIRLVNKKNAERLHELNIKSDRLHFAFDDLSYENEVRRGIEILEEAGFVPRYLMCYILARPGGFEDAWKRLEIIWKDYQIDPFVQIYNNSREDKRIRKLARWCNKPQLRKTCEFREYE